jgi:hypothetical protein
MPGITASAAVATWGSCAYFPFLHHYSTAAWISRIPGPWRSKLDDTRRLFVFAGRLPRCPDRGRAIESISSATYGRKPYSNLRE